MKKFITLFLALALVLTAVSGTALTLSGWMVWGSWNHFEVTNNGMLLTSIYLEEDGTAYFMTQLFVDGAPGVGRAYVGSWEITSDRYVHIVTGENTCLDLCFKDYNEMDDSATGSMYFRAELK